MIVTIVVAAEGIGEWQVIDRRVPDLDLGLVEQAHLLGAVRQALARVSHVEAPAVPPEGAGTQEQAAAPAVAPEETEAEPMASLRALVTGISERQLAFLRTVATQRAVTSSELLSQLGLGGRQAIAGITRGLALRAQRLGIAPPYHVDRQDTEVVYRMDDEHAQAVLSVLPD